ncbi:protein mistic [Bacillus mangrovi]|uniref:Protein mistic n=1 Tax=Metabacillus mangrovi TaxID=1491830 RepID=A0A7X2V719_9BACI|nr:protein mistic [Metabacillus mangrovi]
MKISGKEKDQLSSAIDEMNEALDVFIQLYNQSEEDKPLITFSKETEAAISRAVELYGEDQVTEKINLLLKEFLSFPESTMKKGTE